MTDTKEQTLSVAEVLEMVPGNADNPQWINGIMAVVREIKRTEIKKTGKPMFICTLADTVGSATISMTLFTAPKFSEGDQIEIAGTGTRRTEFNGLQQISPGKNTEFHILGKSVHHEEQKQRAANGTPSVNGQLQPVAGAAVGAALNQAWETFRFIYTPDQLREMVKTAPFWSAMHEMCSDQIRVARLLEMGKLAPAIKERNGSKPVEKPAPPPPPPPPPPKQEEIEEDVPF